MQTKFPVIETHHLVLYPVEPGIFLAYFIRPEDSFIDLHSSLAIYQAIFPCTEKGKRTIFTIAGKLTFICGFGTATRKRVIDSPQRDTQRDTFTSFC